MEAPTDLAERLREIGLLQFNEVPQAFFFFGGRMKFEDYLSCQI